VSDEAKTQKAIKTDKSGQNSASSSLVPIHSEYSPSHDTPAELPEPPLVPISSKRFSEHSPFSKKTNQFHQLSDKHHYNHRLLRSS
jgi:hypothetical protein